MSLQRVLADLATRYPAEDRMVPDLERITLLLDLLGSPQRAYPSIHLTGTNGKSSTARMIDALLQGFGLRPGRYTSPHLDSVTERITVDGQPLTEEQFVEVYDELGPYVELVDSRALVYRQVNTATSGRYRVTKTYTTDPDRSAANESGPAAL